MRKRFLSFVLLLAVCSTMFAPAAMAVSASYSSTQAFLRALDEEGIIYTLHGIDERINYECVTMNNKGEELSYTINYFFSEDSTYTGLRVWNVITYNDSDLAKVLRTCNSLNSDYKYVKFYADESDNTVTVEMDLIHRSGDVGDIVLEATLRLANVLDESYERLAVYDR